MVFQSQRLKGGPTIFGSQTFCLNQTHSAWESKSKRIPFTTPWGLQIWLDAQRTKKTYAWRPGIHGTAKPRALFSWRLLAQKIPKAAHSHIGSTEADDSWIPCHRKTPLTEWTVRSVSFQLVKYGEIMCWTCGLRTLNSLNHIKSSLFGRVMVGPWSVWPRSHWPVTADGGPPFTWQCSSRGFVVPSHNLSDRKWIITHLYIYSII